MPVITFDDFAGGLDVRPLQYMSRPNILRTLLNAYVTTGKTIKKRPCLQFVATLEAGTVGLKSFNGKLQTFYGQGAAIVHANALFNANRVPQVGHRRRPGEDPLRRPVQRDPLRGRRVRRRRLPAPLSRRPGRVVSDRRGAHQCIPPADGGERLSLRGDCHRGSGRVADGACLHRGEFPASHRSERVSLRSHRDRRRRPLWRGRAGVAVDARPHGDRQPWRRSGDVDLPRARWRSSRSGRRSSATRWSMGR
jgi:hypothetical protein